MRYNEYKALMAKKASQNKKASVGAWAGATLLVTGLLGNAAGGLGAVLNGATNAALLHLGVNAALGIGGGALLAKATSKGQQDVEDIKKEYEAERLKTDIGELQTKINQEAAQRRKQMAPLSMRMV